MECEYGMAIRRKKIPDQRGDLCKLKIDAVKLISKLFLVFESA